MILMPWSVLYCIFDPFLILAMFFKSRNSLWVVLFYLYCFLLSVIYFFSMIRTQYEGNILSVLAWNPISKIVQRCLLNLQNLFPTPGQTLGIWLFSVPGKWGIWWVRPSPRGGEFDFCLGGVGEIEPQVLGFEKTFLQGPKSLTAINTCLDETF